MVKASALRTLGRLDEAIDTAREACCVPNAGFLLHAHLAAALGDAGRREEARATLGKARELQPKLSLTFFRVYFIGMHKASLGSLLSSLRKAGLPETADEAIGAASSDP